MFHRATHLTLSTSARLVSKKLLFHSNSKPSQITSMFSSASKAGQPFPGFEDLSDVIVRPAEPKDKDQVLAIQKGLRDVHLGLDYLPALYDEYLATPFRHSLVAEKDGKVVSYGITTVVDGGTHASFGSGRTLRENRSHGLISLMVVHMLSNLNKTYPKLASSSLVYQLPKFDEEFFQKLAPVTERRVSLKADGFDVTPSEVLNLRKCLNNENSLRKPIQIQADEIWSYLKHDDIRKELFPDDLMLISSEVYRPMEENFKMLKDLKLKNILVTLHGDPTRRNSASQSGIASGLSFQTTIPVELGILHKINVFARPATDLLFDHFSSHVKLALEEISTDETRSNIFTVFLPRACDKEAFRNMCYEELGLLPSKHPKVSCDIHVVFHTYKADVNKFLEVTGKRKKAKL